MAELDQTWLSSIKHGWARSD